MTRKEKLEQLLNDHTKNLRDITRQIDTLEVSASELVDKIEKIMSILKIEENDYVKYNTRTTVNKKYVVDNFKDKDFVKIEKVETIKETINRKELDKYILQNNINSEEIYKVSKKLTVKD